MLKQSNVLFLYGSLAAAVGTASLAAENGSASSDPPAAIPTARAETHRLVAKYETFAGSDANARALVTGLRNGTSVTLAGSHTAVRFTPATGPMGLGSVNIALAMAKAELHEQGIAHPTPAQIQATLNGGTLVTPAGAKTLTGILQSRNEGRGWVQVAKNRGLTLAEVVRASRVDKPVARMSLDNPLRPTGPEKTGHVEPPEHIQQPAQ